MYLRSDNFNPLSGVGLGALIRRPIMTPVVRRVYQIRLPRRVRGMGSVPAGCPMNSDGSCGDPINGTYSCALVRECDPSTGAVHYEYTLPSGPVRNANIWSVNPDGSGLLWLNASGAVGGAPSTNEPTPTLGMILGSQFRPQFGGVVRSSEPLVPLNVPPVLQLPAPGGGTKTGGASGGSSGAAGGGSTASPPGSSIPAVQASSFFSNSISLLGINVPLWALGVGALVIVPKLLGGSK